MDHVLSFQAVHSPVSVQSRVLLDSVDTVGLNDMGKISDSDIDHI